MRLGLDSKSYMLRAGLSDYQPVGKGVLTPVEMVEEAKKLDLDAIMLKSEFISQNVPSKWDMLKTVAIRTACEQAELAIAISTNSLDGEYLSDLIRAAHMMGAKQVTTSISHLKGNVSTRKERLEQTLNELNVAIKTAEKYKITLAIENGVSAAAADILPFVQAAESANFSVSYNMANSLTVPEVPADAAELLGKYLTSAVVSDSMVYRTPSGIMLINSAIGKGAVDVLHVLKTLNKFNDNMYVFLNTAAERTKVELLSDQYLVDYPRISARALADILRRGPSEYVETEHLFPFEERKSEQAILKWEEDRLKESLIETKKLLGYQTLPLF